LNSATNPQPKNPLNLPNIDTYVLKRAAKTRLYQLDILSFFRQQLKIQTKEMRTAVFEPNAVQVFLMQGMIEQLRTKGKIRQIWMKCRQPGASTMASGIIAWKTFLFPNVYSFVVAQDKTTVERIFTMHSVFHEHMAEDVRPQRQYFTKGTELVFGNPDTKGYSGDPGLRSRILVGEGKNINVGTGFTIHGLHLSEVCRYPYEAPLNESLLPALSNADGTVRIIESTAHFAPGANWFRDQCERARAGDTDYQYQFIEWWRLPEYSLPMNRGEKLRYDSEEKILMRKYKLLPEQIKWRRLMINEMKGDIDSFRLSYPMNYDEAWITRENSTFPRERLLEMREMIRDPLFRKEVHKGQIYDDPAGRLEIWHVPEKGKTYDIGADVAGGMTDGGDYSVASIIERYSNTQVAQWKGQILPADFGDILFTMGRFYNTAQIGHEVNEFGHSVTKQLMDRGYPNIYIWRKRDTIVPKFTGLVGWKTQHDSKSLMVNNARHLIWNKQVMIHSKDLWEEMLDFIQDYTPTGMITYRAFRGHDDCVMSWMIALQISDDENFQKWEQQQEHHDSKQTDSMPEAAFYDSKGIKNNQNSSLKDEIGDW